MKVQIKINTYIKSRQLTIYCPFHNVFLEGVNNYILGRFLISQES